MPKENFLVSARLHLRAMKQLLPWTKNKTNKPKTNKQTQTLVQMHELNSLRTPIVSALWIWGSAIPKLNDKTLGY